MRYFYVIWQISPLFSPRWGWFPRSMAGGYNNKMRKYHRGGIKNNFTFNRWCWCWWKYYSQHHQPSSFTDSTTHSLLAPPHFLGNDSHQEHKNGQEDINKKPVLLAWISAWCCFLNNNILIIKKRGSWNRKMPMKLIENCHPHCWAKDLRHSQQYTTHPPPRYSEWMVSRLQRWSIRFIWLIKFELNQQPPGRKLWQSKRPIWLAFYSQTYACEQPVDGWTRGHSGTWTISTARVLLDCVMELP